MKKVIFERGETRKEYLLRVAIAFLEQFNDYDNVIFDETECDSKCLIEDIKSEL